MQEHERARGDKRQIPAQLARSPTEA
jgi:hypothetical protein